MKLYRCLFLLVSILYFSCSIIAQQNYEGGSLTQLNLNFSLPKDYKLNTKFESRQIFSEKAKGELKSNRFRYERTDLHFILTKKISADNTIGAGYLIRLEEDKFVHRFIQQFNKVQKLDLLRLAHRVVLDETISSTDPFQVRVRYRLGVERALEGREVDPHEFYLKVNNEWLGIFSEDVPDLEIRALVALGYNASDDNKIELGPEYRVNEFYTGVKAQQFWLNLGWYLSF